LEDYQVSGFQVSGFGFYVSTVSRLEIREQTPPFIIFSETDIAVRPAGRGSTFSTAFARSQV
jgi:hypothetical protein